MVKWTRILLAGIFLITVIAGAGLADNLEPDEQAVEILQAAREAYEETVEGVDDFVLVTDSYTSYHRKVEEDGRSYFEVKIELDEGDQPELPPTTFDEDFFSSQLYQEALQKASYGGITELDNREVHLLEITEIEGLVEDFELDDPTDMELQEDTIERVRVYFDTDEYLLRGIDFSVRTVAEGQEIELDVEVRHEDYQEVEGLVIPFRTVSRIKGLSETLTEEQLQQAEIGMQEMQQQLEQMPPEQREVAEAMMQEQIEQFQQMLEQDQIEHLVEVEEVKVNVGLEEF